MVEVALVLVLCVLKRLVKEARLPVRVLIAPVLAETPPANVLVPCPAPTVIAEARVVVAAPVTFRLVASIFVLKKLVVVAEVPVAATKEKFWKMD